MLWPRVDIYAQVTKDIADLVPAFLQNRKSEVQELRSAIAEQSADLLDRLACRMFGVGNPFGFRQITTFGRLLREASAQGDFKGASGVVDQYAAYLKEVQIAYVEAPPKRPQWEPRSAEERRQESVPVPVERRSMQRRKSASGKEAMRPGPWTPGEKHPEASP